MVYPPAPRVHEYGDDFTVPAESIYIDPHILSEGQSEFASSITASSASFSVFDCGVSPPHEVVDYPHYSNPGPPDIGLHTTDWWLCGPDDDAARHITGTFSSNDNLPIALPLSFSAAGSQLNHRSSDGEYTSQGHLNCNSALSPPARSPSPQVGTIIAPCPSPSTIRVIKASVYGTLRKARARTKNLVIAPAETARDIIEARGFFLAGVVDRS
ncbi:hypothetical protein C8R47DRAFT_1329064 [Mycena vitilis]|nr:hypothetical protein C8R47DRAFT_1329064 [Mycena vitilis]